MGHCSQLVTTSRDRIEESSTAIKAETGVAAVTALGMVVAGGALAAYPPVDASFFVGRGVMNSLRTLKFEWDRWAEELVTEEGGGGRRRKIAQMLGVGAQSREEYIKQMLRRVDQQCDHWEEKLEKLGSAYSVLVFRTRQAIAATEQLRADLHYVWEVPLGEGETSYDRLAVQSMVATLWKMRMDAALGIQSASPSMTAISVRNRLGRYLRLGITATLLGNLGTNLANIGSFISPHLMVEVFRHVGLNFAGLAAARGAGLLAFAEHITFALGEGLLALHYTLDEAGAHVRDGAIYRWGRPSRRRRRVGRREGRCRDRLHYGEPEGCCGRRIDGWFGCDHQILGLYRTEAPASEAWEDRALGILGCHRSGGQRTVANHLLWIADVERAPRGAAEREPDPDDDT
jgi:hypothetical protein